MKHPLKFVSDRGKLADALGLTFEDRTIELLVQNFAEQKKSLRQLLEAVSELDISDEQWANFLYTFGYWQGGQDTVITTVRKGRVVRD